MGFHKIVVTTDNVHKDLIGYFNNPTGWKYIPSNNKCYEKRNQKFKYGFVKIRTKKCSVEYLRSSQEYGMVRLSFNIPYLLTEDNMASVAFVDFVKIYYLLRLELLDIINLDELSNFTLWKVSEIEVNIDLPGTNEDIDRYLDVISKIKVKRKNTDYEYQQKGTLYLHSGNDNKSAGVRIIAYKKFKERIDTGYLQDVLDFKTKNFNDCNANIELLRIEKQSSRRILNYEFSKYISKAKDTPFTSLCSSKHRTFLEHNLKQMYSFSNEITSRKLQLKTLETNFKKNVDIVLYNKVKVIDVLTIPYYISVVKGFITQFNLDKTITTRDKLFKIIRTNFTKTKAKTAVNLIKFLNGEKAIVPISKRYFKQYIKEITSTGYHYIYSDKELPPIIIDDIIRNDLI